LDVLVEIADDSYVVQEALSFSDSSISSSCEDSLEMFCSVREHALRVENAVRLWQSLVCRAYSSGNRASRALDQAWDIFASLRAFLPRSFSLSVPCQLFADTYARSCPKPCQGGPVDALSLIWFRHRSDVAEDFSINDEIPLTIAPVSIRHLLSAMKTKRAWLGSFPAGTAANYSNGPSCRSNSVRL